MELAPSLSDHGKLYCGQISKTKLKRGWKEPLLKLPNMSIGAR